MFRAAQTGKVACQLDPPSRRWICCDLVWLETGGGKTTNQSFDAETTTSATFAPRVDHSTRWDTARHGMPQRHRHSPSKGRCSSDSICVVTVRALEQARHSLPSTQKMLVNEIQEISMFVSVPRHAVCLPKLDTSNPSRYLRLRLPHGLACKYPSPHLRFSLFAEELLVDQALQQVHVQPQGAASRAE